MTILYLCSKAMNIGVTLCMFVFRMTFLTSNQLGFDPATRTQKQASGTAVAEEETKEKDADADVKLPAKEETHVADSETVAEMEGTGFCFPAFLSSVCADA